MKRPMIPDSSGEWTSPEQLLAEIARMDRGRKLPGGRKPSAMLLAVLTGLAAAAALTASFWTLCYAVSAGDRLLSHIREEVTCVLTVCSPETAVWEESRARFDLETDGTEELTFTRLVPAPVEEREDSSLLPGETRVIREGADGLEEVTERLCQIPEGGGSREVTASLTVMEPVARVMAVGTGSGQEAAVGRFQWPCRGPVTSPFGVRHIFGRDGFHRGTDIAAPLGTEIHAAAAGTVCLAGEQGSYGNLVQVDHGNGYVTCYAHCSELLVSEGDRVEQGQTVALVGSTGRSTGPHCHFEIRWQGEPFDAESCLP